ncbi:MAG: cell surface protein SprA [Chitinophagales bacterium]
MNYLQQDTTQQQQEQNQEEETPPPELQYPMQDRDGDFMSDQDRNTLAVDDPSIIEKNVEYDPETDRYILTETINGQNVRPPSYMTFEEYRRYESQRAQQDYWKERSEAINLVEKEGVVPELYVDNSFFDRLFGGTKIDIKPSGNVDITFGGNVQKIDNPTLTERQRKQGGFDFDMNINMNVVGKIGDKLKLNLSYNTEATFDFDNQINLNYEGEEDDIIKKIEAGNVSFPLPTSLINGPQSLFGVRTQLQFGRLTISTVYSQQKSQSQNLSIQDGAQIQEYEVFADDYDENRHFFLAQEFRDSYNQALSSLPNINSLYNVTRVEVWVTNSRGVTQNGVRDVVAFQDLGEPERIARPDVINVRAGADKADNYANDLYSKLNADPATRSIDNSVRVLSSPAFGLENSLDFEKTYARKLTQSEYSFNPQLGYISLNQQLNPNDVLAVAYEYTFNGEVHRVGEFGQDLPQDSISPNKILFLKLLKSTTVAPTQPMWDLMMKNIYSIGAFQINSEDFKLNVLYQDPGGGEKRYIPEGSLQGKPLIGVLNLDNLNNQLDPQPDGIFDYYPGVTINPQNGRIIFPVLEPFGDNLRDAFASGEEDLANNYVYDLLYDSTKIIAQQFPEFNRYVISGTYKSSVSSEISLGAFNIPEGSVTVTAGGRQLVEGQDYDVDYQLGRVKILNEGILNSGAPVNVQFENNALFGFQQKSLFGNRLDYRVNEKLSFGSTFMHMKERPFTQKVNVGDDPISNSIIGFDFNYNTESEFLTWLVDKLPFYETTQTSTFTLAGEMARLKPGHSKAIGDEGTVYVDDFEGVRSAYDLKFPANNWKLASTPEGATGPGGNELFPEASRTGELEYNYNRAKLAWYNIDPLFLRNNVSTPDYIRDNSDLQSNHYVREVLQTEVFPQFTNPTQGFNSNLVTLDMAYYPEERGPYNFESTANGAPGVSRGVAPDGKLKDPSTRWAGVMRNIDNSNFEQSNIEFIEFWVLDPFIYDSLNRNRGDLYFNLGNISEDALKDNRYFYENGLTDPSDPSRMDETVWGRVPRTQPIVNAFDNDPDARAYQDVGYDGLNDGDEREHYSDFLNDVQNVLNADAFQQLQDDPSSDNYRYYRDDNFDDQEVPIIDRYKDFNNPHGNSPVSQGGDFASAQTNLPDSEDLNRDNTLNETESYFQYRVPIFPGMEVGDSYITNTTEATVRLANGNTETVTWYQFKIPINEYDKKVGTIQDFRSIRFIRMFMTDFNEPVVMRFARLELVRNQWRRYLNSLLEPGEYVPDDVFDETLFNVSAVNIEENSERDPIPYVLPEGIQREQNIATQNTAALLNEQSLSVRICDLQDGDSRAVFKNVNLDIRVYERLKMFVHAESLVGEPELQDGDLTAFIRIGRDFKSNYYEYEIPLEVTDYGVSDQDADLIWPDNNELNINLDSLVLVKQIRNLNTVNTTSPYTITDSKGNNISIVGNPDIGKVRSIMLGIRNPKATGETGDDGLTKCVEVWFNELRLEGFEDGGGWAAMGRAETQLADLGNIVVAANMHTIGYGQLEQQVQERFRDNFWQYDFATNLELGKLLPKKLNLRLPFYASISQSFSTPEYDPYDLDIKLSDKLNLLGNDEARDYKRTTQDIITIKSFNFTNVRYMGPEEKEAQPRFYDPENLNFTYAYTITQRSDPLTESDVIKRYRGSLGYNHSPQTKYLYPFKKLIKSRSKWLDIIKDVNVNFFPSNLSFSTDFNRQFGRTQLRKIGGEEIAIDPTFDKYFTWDRFYGIKYNPFQSLSFDFTAANNARIDEPPGAFDGDDAEVKKDSVWSNIYRFGRTTNYTHSTNLSYTAPIDKIPMLDWTQIRASYNTSYTWVAGRLVRDVNGQIVENPFGNTISNTQNVQINGDLNFKNLYNKWNVLKPYNSSRRTNETADQRDKKREANDRRKDRIDKDIEKTKDEISDTKEEIKEMKRSDEEDKKSKIKDLKKQKRTQKQRVKKLRKDKKRITPVESPYASPFIRPLIALKRVSVNYSDNRSTTLPGYLPKTRFLGQDAGFDKPGADFIFGYQPNQQWLDEAASDGWITPDTNLNYQYTQSISKNLNIKATLEPFRDFRVDLTLSKTESENFSEYFKRQFEGGPYEHLNPMTSGSYNITYMAIGTMFKSSEELFENLENYRRPVSQRIGDENPYSTGEYVPVNDTVSSQGYKEGYGPYSQDVIIPAFIAAYTGKNTEEVKLNPFKQTPLPNWRVTYNGLGRMKLFENIFKNVNITHGYNSNFTLSGYISDLNYEGDGYLSPSVIDTLSNNYNPQLAIAQVVISEQFSPLIGIDITWANDITTRFDYKKSRSLSMSMIDYRLSETNTTEFSFSFGYRMKGLTLPFKIGGKKRSLNNDINFNFEFSIRDNVTTNYILDQDISQPTQGMKTIRVSPSIDYVINKRLNIRLFFDRNRTIPATSASYPITNTKAGITLRFSLAQ